MIMHLPRYEEGGGDWDIKVETQYLEDSTSVGRSLLLSIDRDTVQTEHITHMPRGKKQRAKKPTTSAPMFKYWSDEYKAYIHFHGSRSIVALDMHIF